MATVSDDLVERVAAAITFAGRGASKAKARAAIAALSKPEFVLPLAEEMLREAKARTIHLFPGKTSLDCLRMRLPGDQQTGPGTRYTDGSTLLGAYRAAKGE